MAEKTHPKLVELTKEIERLEKLVPKADLSINKDHSRFLIQQANVKYRKNRNKLTTQIPLVKTADTIETRLNQLRKEATRVKQFLGTRYLSKTSRNPLGKAWSFKPNVEGNKMVNPWYDSRFDEELIADKKAKLAKLNADDTKGLIDDYGGKGEDRLTRAEAIQILTDGRETVFEGGKATTTPLSNQVKPINQQDTQGKEAVGLEADLQAQLKAFKPTTIQKQLLKAGFTKGELIKKMNAHEKWKADRRR